MGRTPNIRVKAKCPECKQDIHLEGGKNVVRPIRDMIKSHSCGPCAHSRRKKVAKR